MQGDDDKLGQDIDQGFDLSGGRAIVDPVAGLAPRRIPQGRQGAQGVDGEQAAEHFELFQGIFLEKQVAKGQDGTEQIYSPKGEVVPFLLHKKAVAGQVTVQGQEVKDGHDQTADGIGQHDN